MKNSKSGLAVGLAALLAMATAGWAADAGVEMGAEDDLTVLGTEGDLNDADLEVKGYSVFGTPSVPVPSQFTNGAVSVVIASNLFVAGEFKAAGGIHLSGANMTVSNLTVQGILSAEGSLFQVLQNSDLQGNVTVGGDQTVSGNQSVTGSSSVGSLGVTANGTVGGTLGVTGDVTLGEDLSVAGTATIGVGKPTVHAGAAAMSLSMPPPHRRTRIPARWSWKAAWALSRTSMSAAQRRSPAMRPWAARSASPARRVSATT